MQHEIDLEAWKREGRRFWARIQKEKLVVLWWKNPGIRIAIVAAVFLTLAVVSWFGWKRTYLPIASLIVAVPFCYVAIRLLLIGIRTRGLYSFFTEDGFA